MAAQSLSSAAMAPVTPNKGAGEGSAHSEDIMNAQAVSRVEAAAVAAPVSDADNIMHLISRLASDPTIDIDRVERFMQMHEKAKAAEAETAYNEAMSAAQAEMGPIATDQHNSQTKSKYASYAALDRAVRPIYVRHGFALSFNTDPNGPADHLRVCCKATRSSHAEFHQVDMPSDGKGAKGGDVMTKTHAAGSAMSYGQRYLLKMIFNLAVGEDDDGQKAGRTAPPISGAAHAALNALRQIKSVEALKQWRAGNDEEIKKLDRNDFAAVRRGYQDHFASLEVGQ